MKTRSPYFGLIPSYGQNVGDLETGNHCPVLGLLVFSEEELLVLDQGGHPRDRGHDPVDDVLLEEDQVGKPVGYAPHAAKDAQNIELKLKCP